MLSFCRPSLVLFTLSQVQGTHRPCDNPISRRPASREPLFCLGRVTVGRFPIRLANRCWLLAPSSSRRSLERKVHYVCVEAGRPTRAANHCWTWGLRSGTFRHLSHLGLLCNYSSRPCRVWAFSHKRSIRHSRLYSFQSLNHAPVSYLIHPSWTTQRRICSAHRKHFS